MEPQITVACALIGNKWPDVWVWRLKRMVEENCSVPFDFKCITDRPENFPGFGVPFSREIVLTDDHHSRIPNDPRMILNRDKPQGCWAKLDFFKDGFSELPVIGMDLDVVILDDIAPLVRDTLHMPQDTPGHHNGSVYSFTPGSIPEVYPKFIPYREYPRGEQEYVAAAGEAQPLPDCYSFKLHIASRPGKEPPPGTRIVYFHGRPTPATEQMQQYGWISRTWKGLPRLERI